MKIIIFTLLILFSSICVYSYDFSDDEEITNFYIVIQNKNNSYEILEKKVYDRFRKTNKECLSKLNLTKNQEEKINKLQNKFIKIAKQQGIKLNNSYKEYKKAYQNDPNSSNTKKKKEKLKEIVAETKKDYYIYQEDLFKILTLSQQETYKKYIENELNEIKNKYNKKNQKNKEG